MSALSHSASFDQRRQLCPPVRKPKSVTRSVQRAETRHQDRAHRPKLDPKGAPTVEFLKKAEVSYKKPGLSQHVLEAPVLPEETS